MHAAYKELRIARHELALYGQLDDEQMRALSMKEAGWHAQLHLLDSSTSLAERALAQSASLDAQLRAAEKLRKAQQRTHRWRTVALSLAAASVVVMTVSLSVR